MLRMDRACQRLTHGDSPSEPCTSRKAGWEHVAESKRAAVQRLLPNNYLLPPAFKESLGAFSDVRCVPHECGLLSATQLEITDIDDLEELVCHIRNGKYSSIAVADAYCARAAIAHQLAGFARLSCAHSLTTPYFRRQTA